MFKGWGPTEKEQQFLKNNEVHNGKWHLSGEEVEEEKIVALGRSCYYLKFIETLSNRLGKTIFQSDFMTWRKGIGPWNNLKYYIDTTREIHFSLRGVNKESLEEAFKDEGFIPYMTSREIRYIYHNPKLLKKTYWYVEDAVQTETLKKYGIIKIRTYKSNSPELNDDQIVQQGYKYYNIV